MRSPALAPQSSSNGPGGLAVATDDPETLRLAHPVYEEVIGDSVPSSRRPELLRRYLRHVGGRGAGAAHEELRMAVLRLDAGMAVEPSILVHGARLAREANDFVVARRLGLAALENGAGDAIADVVGAACYELAEYDRAAHVVAGALARESDEFRRVELALILRDVYFWGHNDAERTLSLLQETAASLTIGPLIDAMRAAEATTLAFARRHVDAMRLIEGLEDPVRPVESIASVGHVVALALAGRTADAVSRSSRELHDQGVAGAGDEPLHPSTHYIGRSFALTTAGRLTDAVETAARAHIMATAIRMPLNVAWSSLNAASAELLRGRLEAARRWALEAYALAESQSLLVCRRLALTAVLCVAAQLDERDVVAPLFERLEELPPDVGFLGELTAVGRGWALHSLGRRAEAKAALDAGVLESAVLDLPGSEAHVLHETVRLGWSIALDRFDELEQRSDSRLLAARAAYVRGIARHQAELLRVAEESFLACDAWLFAAESAVAAARCHSADGDERGATAARVRASDHLGRSGPARTPALVEFEGDPQPLSTREREIALLAADGRTSKEIGAELFLSPRTVENHLQRAYTKLGVGSRAELVALLRRAE